jgi:hypothetical protein
MSTAPEVSGRNPRVTPIKPLALRRKATARALSIGVSKVDELIATGNLDAVKSGKILLITMASVERYLNNLPKAELQLPKRLRTKRS